MTKKILITGYKGFIGQNMVNSLSENNLILYEWGEKLPEIDSTFDWVIHLGAISSTTEKDVEKVMTQNYDFSVWLLNRCLEHEVNLQYSSSASVYGLCGNFCENGPVDPKSPYAWSKYLFDRYVNKIGNTDITIQGFRYFNVYGPHEEHKGGQASPFHQFEKQFQETGAIKVFKGSENFKRDFIHVSNVVKTHIEFFKVKESGIWNVGTGSTLSFLDVAKSMSSCIIETDFPEHLRYQYQSYTCSDTTKMRETIKKYQLNLV